MNLTVAEYKNLTVHLLSGKWLQLSNYHIKWKSSNGLSTEPQVKRPKSNCSTQDRFKFLSILSPTIPKQLRTTDVRVIDHCVLTRAVRRSKHGGQLQVHDSESREWTVHPWTVNSDCQSTHIGIYLRQLRQCNKTPQSYLVGIPLGQVKNVHKS